MSMYCRCDIHMYIQKYIDREKLYKIIWLLNERWFCRLCNVQSFPVKTIHIFLTSWVGLHCISTVFYSPWHPRWRKFELDVLWNDATSCTSSNKNAKKGARGSSWVMFTQHTAQTSLYSHWNLQRRESTKNIVSHYQSGEIRIDCITWQHGTKNLTCVLLHFQLRRKNIDLSSTIDCHITKNRTWDRHESRSIWTAVAILAPQWEIPWEIPAKAQGRLGLEEESTLERWNCGTLEVDVPDNEIIT